MVHLLASIVLLRSLMNHSHVKSFHASIILIALLKQSVISFWLLSKPSPHLWRFLLSLQRVQTWIMDLFFIYLVPRSLDASIPTAGSVSPLGNLTAFYTCHIQTWAPEVPRPQSCSCCYFPVSERSTYFCFSHWKYFTSPPCFTSWPFKVYSQPTAIIIS